MLAKIKEWLFGKVILQKVIGKFVKGALSTLAGMAGVTEVMTQAGVSIDWARMETYLIAIIGGLIPTLINFLKHRFD